MRFFYNLGVLCYFAGISMAALFSAKARKWVHGRRGWRQTMQEAAGRGDQVNSPSKTIWFHCASLGEFEQGRPVIEKFRKQYPRWRILLTFFSPSGFEHCRDYPYADHVFYLPPDTPRNVRFFLDTWQPSLAVFVKYEYWYNYLNGLAIRKIPVMVISAIFRSRQHFFRFYGAWFRKHLAHMECIFVQDETSRALLAGNGISSAVVSGDTRFDRVAVLRNDSTTFPAVEDFGRGHHVLVAGSTWPGDEHVLHAVFNKSLAGVKLIIAPHEVDEANIRRLCDLWGKHASRFSGLNGQVPEDARVLIIDRIGMLAHLYRYGQVAYVGGGFGQGIHNILEAATFGLPVIFGPRHHKFAEARDLLKLGGAFCVGNEDDFDRRMNELLTEPGLLKQAGEVCSRYVDSKRGATNIIYNYLRKEIVDDEMGH